MILKICFELRSSGADPEWAGRLEIVDSGSHTIGLRVSILASGSSGNITLLETQSTRLLVDAGLGKRETLARFAAIEQDPGLDRLDGVLISHEHNDHCSGQPQVLGLWNAPLYVTTP